MRPRPDAAENRRLHDPAGALRTRFNEAAARCRGKRRAPGSHVRILAQASMRPRPDAAENDRRDRPGGAVRGASMRPRPDAAENLRLRRPVRGGRTRFNEAAARCRGKPASARGFATPD